MHLKYKGILKPLQPTLKGRFRPEGFCCPKASPILSGKNPLKAFKIKFEVILLQELPPDLKT